MVKILDRLLLFIYSLVIGALSVVMFLLSMRLVNPSFFMVEGEWLRYSFIAGSVVIFLISLRFFYISVRREKASLHSIDQRNDFGDIKISVETVENLVLKSASRIRGVKDLKTKIEVTEAGIVITIRLIVDGESSIPGLTEEVQRQVHGYVQEITGIPVSNVSVYIANIVQTQVFKSRVE